MSPDDTSSINSTIIALSGIIVIISITLISVLACILGYYIIKRKHRSIQDTKEIAITDFNVTDNSAYGITMYRDTKGKITTEFSVSDNSAYGVSIYQEQGIVYEELDSLQPLDHKYEDPSIL